MKITKILIIGGYGNFGLYIAKVLAKNPRIQLIIGGRHIQKAKDCIAILDSVHPAEPIYCDIFHNIEKTLQEIAPDIVIHTSGPFQGQDYTVAKACIQLGCHYLDLSDSREFVYGIRDLDSMAAAKNLTICSGASSVPGLSSAVIEHCLSEFRTLEAIDYAIATAQLTNQGLATTSGVLSYAGKPFNTLEHSRQKLIYGWQDLRLKKFWQLNTRLLGNCDIPDLALFPEYYPDLKTIRFQAGLELKILHLGLFMMSWMVRIKLLPSLNKFAKLFLKISHFFDKLGTDNSGFYMTLSGVDHHNKPKIMRFEIFAEQGDGLYIPCIPAILLAERLAEGRSELKGAKACIGEVSLDDYLEALTRLGLKIQWRWIEQ